MIRKTITAISIAAFCSLLGPSLAQAGDLSAKVSPVQKEKVSKPAGEARKEAKRSFVDPSRGARDRSWSSDTVRRESVKMNKVSRAKSDSIQSQS